MTVPHAIHQVWLGPRPAPTVWTDTWRDQNPDFEYKLWDQASIEALPLRNARLFTQFMRAGRFDGASDVARAEILLRYGGLYIDADSVCLRPLAGAPFLGTGFFAQEEPTPKYEGLITNAFMGATPGHPVLERYVVALSRVRNLRPVWIRTGPVLLTEVLAKSQEPDIQILPAWAFFTATLMGESTDGGRSYGQHFWATTAEQGWDAAEKATPYPISLDSVEGLVEPGVLKRLAELAAKVTAARSIVEIGAYKGQSACHMAHAAKAHVYSVDTWPTKPIRPERTLMYGLDALAVYNKNVAGLGLLDKVTPIRAESTEIAKAWSRPIGLLFIDGGHSYAEIAADFASWSPHLVSGGYLAIHDYLNRAPGFGVHEFVDEVLVPSGDWEDVEVIEPAPTDARPSGMWLARKKASAAA